MFKRKTVFVVGAGASYEFGLPLGVSLKDIISGKLRFSFNHRPMPETGDITLALQIKQMANETDGFSQAEYFRAAEAICRGLPLAISIDNFIDAHRGNLAIERIGKLAIFQSILEAERRSNLYSEHIQNINAINLERVSDTWIASLFRMASEGISKDEISDVFQNVGFISFNYDRCIEQFLEYALRAYYGVERDQAAGVVAKVPIIHPYGVLGSIFDRPNQRTLPFGERPDHLDMFELCHQLRTFTEQVNSDEELNSLRQLLSNAERIVFLGFAFHRQNLDLLAFGPAKNKIEVLGTTYGISEADTEVIHKDIWSLLQRAKINQNAIDITVRNDMKCSDLLKSYWRTLTT
ncbi:hypothetical protein [Thalassospira indica]|uniref:hypothetical protein n=1 Tax=Thalassospira indica TaxID=1891279 RepID=UPI0007FFA090|nr:hypothetical protein [Thalassospira indica]OAZ13425.1 hypothetical protein TH15_10325 [Thalassospira profundimaris]